jgi:CRISPR/Cas system Type II protein with McrA/HNH and RuvC-like nuclease domain
MAVTRLKRKDRRNKARAANRIKRMKQLTKQPVIKNLEESPASSTATSESKQTEVAAVETASEEE